FWEALGARVSALDPEAHDRAVAAISHLPHAVADALMDAVARFAPEALEFAARGFKDTTRIAASDPDMWADIFLANRTALGASLGAFRQALGRGLRANARRRPGARRRRHAQGAGALSDRRRGS